MKYDYTRHADFFQEELKNITLAAEKEFPFIQRMRKITSVNLLNAIVFAFLQNKDATMEDIAEEFRMQGVEISPYAISKHCDKNAAQFLRCVFEKFLGQIPWNERQEFIKLTEHFKTVIIGDSTTIKFPESLKDEYPASGNTSTGSSLKALVQFELLSGRLAGIKCAPGKTSDCKLYEMMQPPPIGTLELYDCGFFSIDRLRERAADGSYWISHIPATSIIYSDGVKYVLGDFLETFSPNQTIVDVDVLLSEEKLPVRLVTFRAPKEVQEMRYKGLMEKHRRSSNKKNRRK